VLSEMKFERMETGRETQGAKSKSMRRAAKKEGTPKNTHIAERARERGLCVYACAHNKPIFLLFVRFIVVFTHMLQFGSIDDSSV
jgi:hypothetical protein